MSTLACYRIANLLPEDDGPLFVFTRIRTFVAQKAVDSGDELGIWSNVDAGINCSLCCGLYAAIIVALLSTWQNYYGNLIILIFAVAGGQSLLVKWGNK